MERKYEGRPELVKPLVISLLFPVLGGIFEYFQHRDSEPGFSKILLYGSFSFPVWFVLNQVLKFFSFSNYWSLTTLMIIFVYILKKLFLNNNKYHDILWIHYLFIFGAVYAYQFKYKGNHELKYLVYHGTAQAFSYALVIGLVLGALSIIVPTLAPPVLALASV